MATSGCPNAWREWQIECVDGLLRLGVVNIENNNVAWCAADHSYVELAGIPVLELLVRGGQFGELFPLERRFLAARLCREDTKTLSGGGGESIGLKVWEGSHLVAPIQVKEQLIYNLYFPCRASKQSLLSNVLRYCNLLSFYNISLTPFYDTQQPFK